MKSQCKSNGGSNHSDYESRSPRYVAIVGVVCLVLLLMDCSLARSADFDTWQYNPNTIREEESWL